MKPEFILGSEDKFYYFMSEIDEEDKVAIISHTDLDGVTSAVSAAKVLDPDLVILSDYGVNNLGKHVEKLKKNKITKLFVFDFHLDNDEENVREINKFADILVLDHHPFDKDHNSAKTVYIKCESKIPACYMSYYLFSKIQKIPSWIVSFGLMSDLFFKYEGKGDKIYEDFNLPKVVSGDLLEEMTKKLASALIYFGGNEKEVFDAFMKAKSIDNLKYLESFGIEVDEEIDFFTNDFETNHEEFGDLWVYQFNPKFRIKSIVISKVSMVHKDKTIVFIKENDNGIFGISARRQDQKKDVNRLLRELTAEIPNSSGGGHKAAAGGWIPAEQVERFKDLIREKYEEMNN